jgi:glycosyltransferase involved in cell wall biosynthesis
MHVSIILSTYNNPEWLEKVLWGIEMQSYKDFEVVIADDGSGDETKQLIERFQNETELSIQHCWHEDNGFKKCQILNIATVAAKGEYLIFTDGDCVPRTDFIATHVQHSEPRHFLSGGYCKLPMGLSKLISKDDIISGRAFDISWLKENGLKSFSSCRKLGLTNPWTKVADKLTSTKPTWNGCNASTWKKDIIEINGHNDTMQYGGEDREMGERLINLGHQSKQLRHRAVLIHLDHSRSYVNQEALDYNMSVREETIQTKRTWSKEGILKLDKP